MALRTFRLTLNGVGVPTDVWPLLGMPTHRRQAQVLVVAPSKAAAHGLADGIRGLNAPARSDPDFRLASGNEVDALAAAGQLDEPRVLAYDGDSNDVPVVGVSYAGRHRVVGRLVRVGHVGFRFDPADGAADGVST